MGEALRQLGQGGQHRAGAVHQPPAWGAGVVVDGGASEGAGVGVRRWGERLRRRAQDGAGAVHQPPAGVVMKDEVVEQMSR